ncbi:MAG: hypothetical protein NTX85_03020 [Candidatus Nomurabacteria bacterium]|nr:hypothetical protein [Candidatus Nomurabacteria bacterium]
MDTEINNAEKKIIKFEADSETIEIFQVFSLDFLTFIRLNPEKWKILENLKENGNEKAGYIIKYIDSFSPGDLFNEKRNTFLGNANHTSMFITSHGAIDLKWSDFEIKESSFLVKFSCEIFLHKKIFTKYIRQLIDFKAGSVLRKKFIDNILNEWLKERGYKLRRYNDEKGRYYSVSSIVMHNEEKFVVPEGEKREYRRLYDRGTLRLSNEATGVYSYEIVKL